MQMILKWFAEKRTRITETAKAYLKVRDPAQEVHFKNSTTEITNYPSNLNPRWMYTLGFYLTSLSIENVYLWYQGGIFSKISENKF